MDRLEWESYKRKVGRVVVALEAAIYDQNTPIDLRKHLLLAHISAMDTEAKLVAILQEMD